MKIVFANVYNPKNAGDTASSPLDYFFGYFKKHQWQIEYVTDNSLPAKVDKDTVLIVGGGGCLNACDQWNLNITEAAKRAKAAIIWGAGENNDPTTKITTPLDLRLFALVGLRDYYIPEYLTYPAYCPCVSALSPWFDYPEPLCRIKTAGAIQHVHYNSGLTLGKFAPITNEARMFDIISYIKNHRAIISDSYHGCYWSILLGRKTWRYLSSNLSDSRFKLMEWQIPIYDKSRDTDTAPSYKDALARTRAHIAVFSKQVMDYIDELEEKDDK